MLMHNRRLLQWRAGAPCFVALLLCRAMLAVAGPEGHYYLSGVRDVGGELLLRPDHRFEWMLMYGAMDRYARGSWQQQGETVVLRSEHPAGEPPLSLCAEAAIRLRKPVEAGSWLVMVGYPGLGPIQYPLEIVFESHTGQHWKRQTDARGEALAKVAPHAFWQRVGVRRPGSAAAWQWFSVPATRRKARLVCLEVKDMLWAMPAAFSELRLSYTDGQLSNEDGWVYRKE